MTGTVLLNEASFVKEIADFKYYKFLFRVLGKSESCTFIADNAEQKKTMIQRIQEIIDNLRK